MAQKLAPRTADMKCKIPFPNRLLEDKKAIEKEYKTLHALKGRDFLSINDLTPQEITALLNVADHLKLMHYKGKEKKHLDGKVVGMYFEKRSTRTRISFENGIFQLGGLGVYLDQNSLQLGRGESIEDTIGVMSRYYDALVCRLYKHEDLLKIAEIAGIPVVNALTDLEHPCQILADLMTIREHKGKLKRLNLTYFGDGKNNVAHSLILAAAKVGMNIAIASPPGYRPLQEILEAAGKMQAKGTCSIFPRPGITVTGKPKDAALAADVIYTDTWVSMGDEAEKEKRKNDLAAYRVNAEIMKLAGPKAIFMHDMPAYRGDEVTAEVIDGPQSVIFDQAENRMHVQKALLVGLLGGKK